MPDHLSLVESACIRPKMYTLHGSFAELVCFLEGILSGAPLRPEAEVWSRLHDRLPRDGVEGVGGWQAGFIALRRLCPDDETALRRLSELYREEAEKG